MVERTRAEQELELLKSTVRLNATVLGIALGLLFGLIVFVATNWLIIKGAQPNADQEMVVGPHLALLSHYFIGYRVTFPGSLIGFGYGFALGAVTGWLLVRIYNRIAGFPD
jgi:hypothetical protein